MIEEAKRLKKANKEGMERQEDLMASAKVLQGRISSQNKVSNFSFSYLPIIISYSYFVVLRFIFDFVFAIC